eukprot:7061612-Prymnesium_polylepis.1
MTYMLVSSVILAVVCCLVALSRSDLHRLLRHRPTAVVLTRPRARAHAARRRSRDPQAGGTPPGLPSGAPQGAPPTALWTVGVTGASPCPPRSGTMGTIAASAVLVALQGGGGRRRALPA